MTRAFGYSLPSTSMIPLADLMNHNNNTTTSSMILTKFEIDGKNDSVKTDSGYLIKKNKINLDIFNIEEMKPDIKIDTYNAKMKFISK